MKKTGGYSVEEISLHDDGVKHCRQYSTCAVATVDVACDYFHYTIRAIHSVSTCTSCMNCESCFGRRGPSAQ